MNVNPKILELKEITGLPVEPDVYEGKSDKYITFTYAAERPAAFGDDMPTEDTAYVMVQLTTPYKFNYLSIKQTIKDYLESIGIVTNVFAQVEKDDARKIRTTTFEVEITEGRI